MDVMQVCRATATQLRNRPGCTRNQKGVDMDTDPPMDTAEAILPGSRKFLEATLAANLSYDLRERRTRVITLGPYYLQWATGGPGLQIEMVSDQFLEPTHQITSFGAARMRELGFAQPTDDDPNWTLWLAEDWESMVPAHALVTAILDVYRIRPEVAVTSIGPLPPPLATEPGIVGVAASAAHDASTEDARHEAATSSTGTSADVEELTDPPVRGVDVGLREGARVSLDMLECADRLRWFTEGYLLYGYSPEVDAADRRALLEAALVLRRRLPISRLVTLGVVDGDCEDSDIEWLLREHLAGRNEGTARGDADLRRLVERLRHEADEQTSTGPVR